MNEFIALEQNYGAHNYHPLPVVLARGKGVYVWDTEGKKYIDLLSAYSAVSHGHAHPRLLKALREQAEKIAVTSRAFYSDQLGLFLKALCELAGLEMAIPMNSGSEAVETAIKAARRWGYKAKGIPVNQAEIIVAEGNFHGRTTTIVGFSSEEAYKTNFGPFTPGFKQIPFGSVSVLEKAITPHTAAFIVEPIQGEAGIIVPPKGWLAEVEKVCRRHRVLLILDEVQSGLGRSGKMFAFQHEGVRPDGLILGKALGGGLLPVSAFVSSKEVMELFEPGSHGSTFGGNPLAAAVGLEALRVLKEEKLVEKSHELGQYLLKRLQEMKSPYISEVRGSGLWVGVVIDPDKASARTICEKLMERGVLAKETHQVVIRIAPPLVITRDEIDWVLEQFQAVLSTI
jgi:ornithine--oxo-acid transaminase